MNEYSIENVSIFFSQYQHSSSFCILQQFTVSFFSYELGTGRLQNKNLHIYDVMIAHSAFLLKNTRVIITIISFYKQIFPVSIITKKKREREKEQKKKSK